MNKEMRNSKIVWLGDIPKNWKVSRCKFYCDDIFSGGTPKTDHPEYWENGNIPWLPSGVCHDGYVSETNKFITKLGYDNSSTMMIPANTAILGMIGGNTGYLTIDACANQSIMAFVENKEKCNSKYLWYQLLASKNYRLSSAEGAVMKGVSRDDCKDFVFVFPELNEQEAIANYLDMRCEEIEKTISQVNQSINKLEELKQSIITKIVFNGLSKNNEYKDSETNWAGKIPVNWTIMPLKTRFNFGKGLSITKADLVDEGLPVISYGQVHAKFNSGVHVDDGLIRYVPESFAQYKESFAHNNDFIFADTSEDLEGCGNCVYVDNEGVYAGYHTVLLSSKYDDNNKYLAYLFKTDAWRYQIRTQLTDVKLFSITQGCLKQTEILLPPQPEQNDIVRYLDEKCSKIDESIKRQKDIIEKLDEYKKSLIYSVVTGKMEVGECVN